MISTEDIAEILETTLTEDSRPQELRLFDPIEISTDSRGISAGALFVAIEGANQDGNDYVTDAMRNGAGGFIASNIQKVPAEIHLLVTLSVIRSMHSTN